MANSKQGQITFPLQAPAAAIYRVGPAGSGMLFTTISSAVAAAVGDGHTDTTNPSIIEVYPGTFTENVALGAGMTLKSMGGATLVGTVTYSPGAGAAGTNTSNIVDMNITPPAATSAIVVGGTVGGTLNLRNTQASPGAAISSNAAGGGSTLFTISNTAVAVRLFDYVVTMNNSADPIVFDLQNGTLELFGGRTLINTGAGVTVATGFKISNAATANIYAQNAVSGSFTQVVDIQATTAACNVFRASVANTLVGGFLFKFTAAGTVRARAAQLGLADATSIIATGAAGSFNPSACNYSGTVAAPFSSVDTGITVNQTGVYAAQKNSNGNEFYVGRGIGYSTIQAAITAANAAAVGARKVVLIAPGTYNESLTLQPNVDLAADTQGICGPNNFSPVTIIGTHTLAFTAINQVTKLKNIRFQSLLVNATALFTISGASTNCKTQFQDCALEKSFAGTAKVFNLTTTATNIGIALTDSSIFFTADGGSVFDLSAATNAPQIAMVGQLATTNTSPVGLGVQIANQTAGVPPTLLLLNCPAVGGCQAVFQSIYISAITTQMVTLNTAGDNVQIQLCRVQQTVNAGQVFFFNGAGLAQVFNSYIQQNDAGGGGTKLIGENTGAGGNFNYGASIFGFGVVNIRLSITTTQLTSVLVGA